MYYLITVHVLLKGGGLRVVSKKDQAKMQNLKKLLTVLIK